MAIERSPVTLAIYGANGAWASLVYLTGPIAPILTEALGVSLGAAGLVGTAIAAGIATAAVTAPPAVAKFGRDGTARLGLALLAAVLATIALVPVLTSGTVAFGLILVLIWLAGTSGGTFLNASTARLSEAHGENGGQAITEATAVAAWVGLFSPLLLGGALGAGLGWWVGILVSLVAVLAAFFGLLLADRVERSKGPERIDPTADERALVVVDEVYEVTAEASGLTEGTAGRLTGIFWLAMVALFAAVAAEFALNFWGSTLIRERTGAASAAATAAMSAVVTGIAIGRTVGSWISARLGPHRMLLAGFSVALLGFGILWIATHVALSVLGLLVAGLGLATLFPLIIDRGIRLSGGRPEQAMASTALVLGLGVGGIPFLLGAMGTIVSVSTALLIVPILIAAGVLGVILSKPRAVSP